MQSTSTWLTKLAVATAVLIVGNSVVAQSRFVFFSVDKLPQIDGTTTYRLWASESGYQFAGIPNENVSLTSPNGTVFTMTFPRPPHEYNSFADVGATLFGDWNVIEHPTSGPDNTFTAHVNTFSFSGSIANPPLITSPESGATIPPTFVVKWVPNSTPAVCCGASWDAPGLSRPTFPNTVQFGVDGTYSARFVTQLLQPPPVDFTLRINNQFNLSNPVPISNRSPSLVGTTITGQISLNSLSLPATYHVVPEPNVMAMLCATLLPLWRVRVRR
jgi:hypothetical protein